LKDKDVKAIEKILFHSNIPTERNGKPLDLVGRIRWMVERYNIAMMGKRRDEKAGEK